MKLKGFSRVFRIGAFIGPLIRSICQGEVFVGAVRILFENVIAIFIFSRIGDVVPFVILCRLLNSLL